MIPLRSVPMLAASLGVVALVVWLAAFKARNEGLFVDTAAPSAVATLQLSPAGAPPRIAHQPAAGAAS